jgi:hypothetical protein
VRVYQEKRLSPISFSVCGVSLIAWHQQRLGVAVLDTSGEQLAFNLALCGTLHIYSRKSCHTKIMLQRCSTATQSHTTHTHTLIQQQPMYIDSRACAVSRNESKSLNIKAARNKIIMVVRALPGAPKASFANNNMKCTRHYVYAA